ncbi:hypothetical protein [Streptomyces griseofuscus]|uniref:hypothetical protein n=1 Tax=Streptomyces griseofuscus TaxID=146922 RepID=UPI0033F4750C
MKANQSHPPPPSSYIIRLTTLKDPEPQPFDPELALVCLDKAVETMTAEGADLQLADALEQRAEGHRLAGHPAEAAEDLRAAAARYEKQEDAVGAERVRERLAALAG